MANIYSGMTSAQKDNERKYLNNLVSGGGGNAEWAKGQLKQLDASGGSTNTTTTSTSGSKNKSLYNFLKISKYSLEILSKLNIYSIPLISFILISSNFAI